MKTNAMRILDAHKIKYEVYEYAKDQSLTGSDIAGILKEDPNRCFKTLITKSKANEYYAFLVPVNQELDLKKAATSIHEKSLEMIPFKDLLKVTGYIHGGCSPIGMKKDYKVTIDNTSLNFSEIYLSGGQVGVQIKLKLSDLSSLINPNFADITRKKPANLN